MMPARRDYPSIQYLRAIAAILVVVHHARNPQTWLFNVLDGTNALTNGVDIFFVISAAIVPLIFGGLALGDPKSAVAMTWTSGIMIEFGMGMVIARLVPVRIGARAVFPVPLEGWVQLVPILSSPRSLRSLRVWRLTAGSSSR